MARILLEDLTSEELLSALQQLIRQELQKVNKETVEVIDRPELMSRLGISEPTAIRWGKSGRIPELRLGGSVRYNWPAVVKALEKSSK